MEEVAVATFAFLVRLILLVAIGAGVVTIAFAGVARRRAEGVGGPTVLSGSSMVERAAVGVSAIISLLALVIAVQTIRSSGVDLRAYRPLSALLLVSTILLGLPAIFWKTRLRWAAEGLASIALAVAADLGIFSIGLFFLPLLVLMTWSCIRHLREVDNLQNHRGEQPLGAASKFRAMRIWRIGLINRIVPLSRYGSIWPRWDFLGTVARNATVAEWSRRPRNKQKITAHGKGAISPYGAICPIR